MRLLLDTRPCIVVVDDDSHSRSALARLLARSGYHVESAESVSQALEVVELRGCDLLISDLGLPDGSGLDLMRQLRHMYGLNNGIALTGYTSAEDKKDCADAGFTKFLPKPVVFTVLLSEVQTLLEGRRGDETPQIAPSPVAEEN